MASLLDMTWVDLLGFAAGALTTFSAAPQLLYSYRTKDVASIDLKFMLMLVSGLTTWAIYGIIIRSLPIIFFNFFGTSFYKFQLKIFPIFFFKFLFRYIYNSQFIEIP